MSPRQFDQLLENHRRAAPKSLFESKAAQHVIRTAATRARAYHAGVDAWRRVARSEWLEGTEFESLLEGVFVVNVAHPTLAYELRRQSGVILRLLQTQIAGVNSIQFRVATRGGRDSRKPE